MTWLLASVACLLWAPTARATSSVCEVAPDATPIQPGPSIFVSLSTGDRRAYSVHLSAGSVAHLVVEEDDPDVRLCIFSSTGKQVADARSGFAGSLVASFVGSQDSPYTIVIVNETQTPEPITCRLRLEIVAYRALTYRLSLQAGQVFLQGQALRAKPQSSASYAAISRYREAQRIWAAASDMEGQVRALLGVAEVWLDLSQYSQALETYAAAERLSSASPQSLVAVLNGRAQVYLDRWDSIAALGCAEEAIRLSRSLGDSRAAVEALVSRGEALYLQTEDDLAARDLDDAVANARAEGDRRALARALRAMAWVEEDRGKLQHAAELMRDSERLFRAIGDVRAAVNAIGDLATIESIRGERYAALGSHMKVLRLLRQMGQISGQAFALEALGADYARLNDDNIAVVYFQQALHVFRVLDHVSGQQSSLIELCDSELSIGSRTSALRDCSESVRIVEKLHDPKREAIALRSLGGVEDSLGQSEQALSLYRRAADLSHSVRDSRFEAASLVDMGRLKARAGDQEGAVELYTRALPLSLDAETPDGVVSTRYEMARSEISLGRIADAQSQLDQALQLAEVQRSNVGSVQLRESYFSSVRKCYDLYVNLLMTRHLAEPTAGLDRTALEKSEASRARTLLEAVSDHRIDPSMRAKPNEMMEVHRLLSSLDAAYERRLNLMIGNGGRQELDRNATEIRLLADECDRAIYEANKHFREAEPPNRVATDQTIADFDSDTVVLEYSLGEERSFAWLIVEGKLATFVLPSRKVITRQVERWQTLATARKPVPGESPVSYRSRVNVSDRELRKIAPALACILLSPLKGTKATRLAIVADGILESVPFSALPVDGCSGNYTPPLITAYEIVNLPSISLLGALRAEEKQRSKPERDVAILADPVFSNDDPRVNVRRAGAEILATAPLGFALRDFGWSKGLPRLPATRRESRAIAGKASESGAFVALDFDANLTTALSQKLSRYRILHFATHGLLDAKHPELSGLVFSLVDRNGNPINGFLQAQDVYNLRLLADLVVLSACDSGGGKQVNGEGRVGLTRAFMHAGVPRVVSTLWSIEDDATSELMSYFYESLLREGNSPAKALRDAQVHILKEKRWESPFFWASFVLTGDWR